MSLPVCGGGDRWPLWAPYTGLQVLRDYTRERLLGPSVTNTCATQCSEPVPSSAASFEVCGSCASASQALSEYYGCTYCQTLLSPLAYYTSLPNNGGTWSYSTVAKYLGDASFRTSVDAAWTGLTECEQGRWVKRTCLRDGQRPVPYNAGGDESSGSGGGSGLSTGAIIGIVVAVVVVLVLVVYSFKGNLAWRVQRVWGLFLGLFSPHEPSQTQDGKSETQESEDDSDESDDDKTETDQKIAEFVTKNPDPEDREEKKNDWDTADKRSISRPAARLALRRMLWIRNRNRDREDRRRRAIRYDRHGNERP